MLIVGKVLAALAQFLYRTCQRQFAQSPHELSPNHHIPLPNRSRAPTRSFRKLACRDCDSLLILLCLLANLLGFYMSIGISIVLTLFIGHYMWHVGSKNIVESSWNSTNTAINHINKNIQSSDAIISGEIYTYFHTSYYNRTNKEIILLKPKEELGWVGEWGLIKKLNTPEISSLESVKSPRIWLILREKTYDEYKKQVPPYWQLKQEFHDGDLIIGLYENKK